MKYCSIVKLGFKNYNKKERLDYIKEFKKLIRYEDITNVDLYIAQKGLS